MKVRLERRTKLKTLALLGLAAATLSCGRGCGSTDQVPVEPPTLTAPDGREYVLLALGPHTPVYGDGGLLARVEYDRNGDGRADQIAHHDGARLPFLVENDDDFDGRTDQWARYDQEGDLIKVGVSRSGEREDLWVYPGPGGQPERQEFDDDGDGIPERAELLEEGRVVGVEVDADRDGRMDRWQDWSQGRLVSEALDTDADGEPDRRLLYDESGRVTGIEPLGH